MVARVSRGDLVFAAEWLEAYEGGGDDNERAARRVADWLRVEIARRARRSGVCR